MGTSSSREQPRPPVYNRPYPPSSQVGSCASTCRIPSAQAALDLGVCLSGAACSSAPAGALTGSHLPVLPAVRRASVGVL